jgi:diguanylate cyclase (GGDEF)-like protein/PAS domain S-box-containing protein
MKIEQHLVALGVLCGLLAWLLDALLDYVFSDHGAFLQLLITDVPRHVIHLRLVLLGVFVLCGLALRHLVTRRLMAEDGCRAANRRYQSLVETSPHGILEVDASGRILFANPAFDALIGCQREQLIGDHVDAVAAAAERDRLHSDLARMQSGETLQGPCHYQVVTQRGETREVEIAWSHKRNAEGAIAGLVAMVTDVTDRRRAEAALNRQHRLMETLMDGMLDPLMVIGTDYRLLAMNRAARDYLREGESLADGLRCHKVTHKSETPCCGDQHPCPLAMVRETGKRVRVEHEHVLQNGEKRTCELEASPLLADDGSLIGIVEASRDITERRRAEQRLRENEARLDYLAHHDALTRLPNRLLFHDRLQHAMAKAARSREQVAVLFIDLDRFKNINDSLGHEAGDRFLKGVADRLSGSIRRGDTVARLGGDEFVVVIERVKDIRAVAAVAEKIGHDLSQGISIGDHELFAGASIGIALFPDDGQDVDALMQCADTAMYRAKERGRNTYQFYTTEMNSRAKRKLFLESDLRRALAQQHLQVLYQPQFHLESQRLAGVEALVRWQHPELGTLMPGDFIPVAEETGLIVPLGSWVMHTACAQNRSWQRAGYTRVKMAVNLSARQFRQHDLVDNVADILESTALAPEYLELELTESAAMDDPEASIATLARLSQHGVALAIDDFGTGYSSLSYLKRFPIDKLKIDRSFVRDITTDANDAAIAASTIALAQAMNLRVTAEGVETRDQMSMLREQGCDDAQGFYYGPAVRAEEFVRYLKRTAT